MFAQENIQPNEAGIIESIVQATIDDQKRNLTPGTMARRDVHSKSHGTFKHADFRTLAVHASCRVGLFAYPMLYSATVRLSNGAPGVGADILPNVRGIALKVHGVSGTKLLAGDEQVQDVDFLLANHPTSFHVKLEDYPPIRDLMSKGKLGDVLKQFPHEGRMLLRAVLKVVKNPLTTAYFSQTAYQFADGRAVKYALIPERKSSFFCLPNVFDKDYLRHAAAKFVNQRPAVFTLCVQFQTENDPIEDSSVLWRGPLVPVARLVIYQGRNVPLLESSGEALSFNPWRTLAEHRPLGWVNRVREAVYRADFNWRTAANALPK